MGDSLELNRAVPGGRVEMFAIEDHDYLGDWFYRFQFITERQARYCVTTTRTTTTTSAGTTDTSASARTPRLSS